MFFYQKMDLRNLYSKKDVAFAVFAFSSLEKTREDDFLFLVFKELEFIGNLLYNVHLFFKMMKGIRFSSIEMPPCWKVFM